MSKIGDCYQAAANLVVDNPCVPLTLCHGTAIGTGPIKGVEFGHAWAEAFGLCFDVANGKDGAIPREQYYRVGKIKDVTCYTREEACEMMLHHKHYGPWEKKSLANKQRACYKE